MSTVVSKNVQIGADGTASNNFTAYQPATPDGTLRIGNGNSGSVTDAITLTSAGNVGIGTSSPSSYASTTLEISGSSASSDLKMTNTTTGTGDAAGFDLELNGSDINYVNRTASGNQKFWTNSTERMRITSAGNVGIGTSSPANALHVKGVTTVAYIESTGINGDIQLKASGTTGYTALRANGNDLAFLTATAERMRITSAGNVGIGGTVDNHGGYARCLQITGTEAALELESSSGYSYVAQNGTDLQIRNVANGNMPFSTNNTERMRIDSAGNVGIGTSSPSAKLDVLGSGTIYSYLRNSTTTALTAVDSSAAYFGSGTSSPVIFQVNNGEKARIDSSGNLGLGVTPSAWYTADGVTRALQISGTGVLIANNGSMRVMENAFFNTSGAATYISNGYAEQYLQNGGFHAWYTATSGTAGAAISFTQAMTLDASGNLLVGTTSSSISNTAGSRFIDSGRTLNIVNTGAVYPSIITNQVGYGGKTISFRYTDSEKGYIETTSTNVIYSTTSDYRLKNTIAPMTGALAKVALLKPCTYKWNVDGSKGQGFIAHELQSVIPDCVSGEKDAVDNEGNPQYQGIDTSFLVATLTAAIQEQQAIIESLKARLDAANI